MTGYSYICLCCVYFCQVRCSVVISNATTYSRTYSSIIRFWFLSTMRYPVRHASGMGRTALLAVVCGCHGLDHLPSSSVPPGPQRKGRNISKKLLIKANIIPAGIGKSTETQTTSHHERRRSHSRRNNYP